MSKLLTERRDTIWYALYCPEGVRKRVVASLRQQIDSEILEDVFIFSYDRLKKYLGEWHLERQPMFPNYIFLESRKPEQLAEEINGLLSFLNDKNFCGYKDISLTAISGEEERLLQSLCGTHHHIKMSTGFIRAGNLFVTEGPLKGKEKMVRHIDRHKRIAKLGTSFWKDSHEVTAGLEIVSKV